VRDRYSSSAQRLCNEANFGQLRPTRASCKLTATANINCYTAATKITDSERQQRADNTYEVYPRA
jgi:hypothetical protein